MAFSIRRISPKRIWRVAGVTFKRIVRAKPSRRLKVNSSEWRENYWETNQNFYNSVHMFLQLGGLKLEYKNFLHTLSIPRLKEIQTTIEGIFRNAKNLELLQQMAEKQGFSVPVDLDKGKYRLGKEPIPPKKIIDFGVCKNALDGVKEEINKKMTARQ